MYRLNHYSAISCVFVIIALLSSVTTISDADELPFATYKIAEPKTHFSATQQCVAPISEMRRNHMNYILHQRDETVYEGIRTRQYALEECINCHVTKDTSGEYARIEDKRHFCSSCHRYAAVSIDCFQCHADVPVRATGLILEKRSQLSTERVSDPNRLGFYSVMDRPE